MISTLSTALSLSQNSERDFVLLNAAGFKMECCVRLVRCTWSFLCNSGFSKTRHLSTSRFKGRRVIVYQLSQNFL